jgi:hypothetical protein
MSGVMDLYNAEHFKKWVFNKLILNQMHFYELSNLWVLLGMSKKLYS